MRDADTNTVMRILIAGSQTSFVTRMRSVFSGSGFLTRAIQGAAEMSNMLSQFHPDVAIVEFAGWSDIRRVLVEANGGLTSPLLALVLSTHRDSAEKTAALNDGADAHATTAADADELRAEVRALMRRAFMAPMAIRVGMIEVDTVHRLARSLAGSVQLTPSECSLLHFVMMRVGNTVPRLMLQEYLGRCGGLCSEDACTQVVRSVRRKLERIGAGGYLLTVIGRGYRLDV